MVQVWYIVPFICQPTRISHCCVDKYSCMCVYTHQLCKHTTSILLATTAATECKTLDIFSPPLTIVLARIKSISIKVSSLKDKSCWKAILLWRTWKKSNTY